MSRFELIAGIALILLLTIGAIAALAGIGA